MKCSEARKLIFQKIDRELPASTSRLLDAHLNECPDCTRGYTILCLPQQVAQSVPPLEPSDTFHSTLRARIEDEAGNTAVEQQFMRLAKGFVPSMAAITMALLSIFAYLHFTSPPDDMYAAYRSAVIGEDPHLRRLIREQQDLTDANILSAIANRESWQRINYEQK